MNPALRTLEEWTTHQDYVWFLAVLAWAGVIGAEFRGKETRRDTAPNGWLIALAASFMAGAILELVLLAQHLDDPYTSLDAAMGCAQVAGTCALVWGATTGVRFRLRWRTAASTLLIALAAVRIVAPVEAGIGLALTHAAAVIAVIRVCPRTFSPIVSGLLVLWPAIATHGPWAYAIRAGRSETDWSRFALPAAAVSLAAGAILAAAAWRRRLNRLALDEAAVAVVRKDLRWAVALLAVWLLGGVLLAVWYGRVARRAFEENLLRRVDTAVLALDERALVEALGPELRITSIEQQRYKDGRPVAVATVPHTRAPVYAALRAQMARVRVNNPDFQFLYVATWRDGHLLVLNSLPRRGSAVTHVIHHDVTPADLDRLADGKSFLEGPVTSESWRPQFSAKAALRHPVSGQLLGWLVADVEATRWMTTFTQARLQTMGLVGAGVGLWALAVAYRLRREARDAAEQKAAAAAAADRTKSAFLAKVSHELRTPIQSVLGYSELLEGAPLAEQHRGWLAALRSHGDIMLRLVNDLIDLGALQSGAFRLEEEPVGLRALVDDCAAALRPAVSSKGLAFRADIAPTVPPWVQADGVRLRQVLLNLLTNAVKFTPAGSVMLTVQATEDAWIEFVVSDTGPGIPVTLRPRLFQPFARLDPAAGGGSGLGLALVQGLCSVMGGTVRCADDVGNGTTFIVRLPLSRCEPPGGESEMPAPQAATPSFAGLCVLVAEDNTLVRELLLAFLLQARAEVLVASDGVTALKLAREREPAVILLDIGLPGMDGIAVTETLRREGSRRVRIIGLSAHVSSQDEARARRAGMDAFLAKPVRLAKLATVISEQLRDSKAGSDTAEHIVDETLRTRLVAQFAEETPGVLAEMRAALVAADWTRLRSRAHYLKNSADVLGARGLQIACHHLASLSEEPAPDAAQRLLEAVIVAIPSNICVLANVSAADKK